MKLKVLPLDVAKLMEFGAEMMRLAANVSNNLP